MFNGSTIKKKIATKYMKKYLSQFFLSKWQTWFELSTQNNKGGRKKAVNEFKKSGEKTRLANSKGVV